MNADGSLAIAALEARFMQAFPHEAARRIETLPVEEAVEVLTSQPPEVSVPIFEQLAEDVQEVLVEKLPDESLRRIMTEMDPPLAAELLQALDSRQRDRCLRLMDPVARRMVEGLMGYSPDTAGQLMDPRVTSFRLGMTAADAIARLKGFKKTRALRELFLVDDQGVLAGRVEIQDLAISAPDEILSRLSKPVPAAVLDVASKEEVVERIQRPGVSVLPVVNVSGRLLGVIHQSELFAALQEEASLDIQTMVGAHKDERALSKPMFAVRKRLPWLQINLATAFLAASVVGLFEGTIAKFTALAVLMPVVAGQSGNTGAQALAVTMRALALREISTRQLPHVVFKEISVGLLNGLAVAATTALGVYAWSGSTGLVAIISIAMVISMIVAGFSGALIPIALSRFGFDPAQSSSIVLTTVTDVTGFFSFLGVATLLQAWL
jgi:magnesium transporter